MTTREFLDAIKARYGLPSDYALAHFLGLSKAVISSYRVGKTRLDDANALKVAKLLELDPGYVLACIHAERARRDDVREIWQKTASALKRSAGVVLVCLLFVAGGVLTGHSTAAAASPAAANFQLSLLCQIAIAWLRRRLRAIFTGMRFNLLNPALLLAACLLVSACGSDHDDDNHGFGFQFDQQAANGLKLRHQPDVVQRILPTHLATLADMYDQTQACTGIETPGPFVIVVANGIDKFGGPGGALFGLTLFDPPLILLDQGPTWPRAARHEFVHYLLNSTGFPRERNIAHDSPFFVDCIA